MIVQVAIPGKDGRAGMAALMLKEGYTYPGAPVADGITLDMTALAKHCTKNLPSYAVPVFLRILPEYVLPCSAHAGACGLAHSV